MRRMNVVNRKQALKVVKELDAFPKVPESYKEQTVSGAGSKFNGYLYNTKFVSLLVLTYTLKRKKKKKKGGVRYV